jgi:WD40 repeat protein
LGKAGPPIVDTAQPVRSLVAGALHSWAAGALAFVPADRLPAYQGTAEVLAWSPDGRYLAVGYSTGILFLWDNVKRYPALVAGNAHHLFISALAWSPDGRMLISAAADGTTIL